MVLQNIDGIDYKLQEPFDMSFLSRYGRVFKVLDQQDSGAICFGAENSRGEKLFVKFAGARTLRANRTPEEAVIDLKAACEVYRDLRHENLVRFIEGEEIAGGFAAVFQWSEAECMGKQYDSRHKFFQLPIAERIHIFEDILEFHRFVCKEGYVAIDFYDGSIMYDFVRKHTVLCDVDCYSRRPYVNTVGRMCGSSRFMSPEEFEKGKVIDEVTNVFNMGAAAFALLGDAADKSFQHWKADKALFEVAEKAVSRDRNQRYQSLDDLHEAWIAAKK